MTLDLLEHIDDTKAQAEQLRESINGRVCPSCSRAKPELAHLCGPCLRRLPRSLRRDLRKPIDNGYPEAIDAAVEWLAARMT